MAKDIKAKILSNEKICASYYKMVLDASYIARLAKPGQFLMLKCDNDTDPLLRRPFSIHRLKALGSRLKGIEILYEVIGKGTEVLANKKIREHVDVLGPLGNGFTLPLSAKRYPLSAILIAGGIGVAPLIFLAEKLVEIQNPKSKIQIIVLIGTKTKKLILCEKDFKKIGAEVHTATDDGSYGYKGFVSNLFKKNIEPRAKRQETKIYACGPQVMLKDIAIICKERKLDCQVSLEENMACGIGACLGCVVKTKAGNKLACKDGPVFNASEMLLS